MSQDVAQALVCCECLDQNESEPRGIDQKIDKEDFSSFYYVRIHLLASYTARTVLWEENMDLKIIDSYTSF